MNTKNAVWIYVTTEDRAEARKIGRFLVEKSLLACANVFDGIDSIYRWQGEVCEATEAALIGKTTADKLPEIKAVLPGLHSYDCPCLVSGAIDDGLPPFLAWIEEQVRSD